jgi:dihydroorotase
MQVCLERKKKENIIVKCGYPFEGYIFNLELPIPCKRRIYYTAFKVKDIRAGKRLLFER